MLEGDTRKPGTVRFPADLVRTRLYCALSSGRPISAPSPLLLQPEEGPDKGCGSH